MFDQALVVWHYPHARDCSQAPLAVNGSNDPRCLACPDEGGFSSGSDPASCSIRTSMQSLSRRLDVHVIKDF